MNSQPQCSFLKFNGGRQEAANCLEGHPSLKKAKLLMTNTSEPLQKRSGEESQVGRMEIPSTGSGQALHFAQNAPFRMTQLCCVLSLRNEERDALWKYSA
jgi:hypothetical protein